MVPSNPPHSRFLVKVLMMWNIALTVLILIGLGLFATAAQAANDPPVRVFTANANDLRGGGNATTANDTITGTLPDTLVSIQSTTLSPNHPHICVVSASATAQHSVGSGVYHFGLSLDGVTAPASDRLIEMFDNPGINDDSFEEVSSVYVWNDVRGAHIFRFFAHKDGAGDSNLIVDASSISVICVKKNLVPATGPAPVDED